MYPVNQLFFSFDICRSYKVNITDEIVKKMLYVKAPLSWS